MLIESLRTHIRCSFFSSPSDLIKSTVVDKSLSTTTTRALFQRYHLCTSRDKRMRNLHKMYCFWSGIHLLYNDILAKGLNAMNSSFMFSTDQFTVRGDISYVAVRVTVVGSSSPVAMSTACCTVNIGLQSCNDGRTVLHGQMIVFQWSSAGLAKGVAYRAIQSRLGLPSWIITG